MARQSLAELIRRGLELKGTIDKSAKDLDEVKDAIVKHAKKQMGDDQKSITLSEATGKAKVTIDDNLSYKDGMTFRKVQDIMKAAGLEFKKYFERVNLLKANAKEVKAALAGGGKPERTLSKIIEATAKKPSVTFIPPNEEDLRKKA